MDANNAEGDSIGKMWRLWIPVIESEDVKKYKDGFKNKHTNNPVHCTLYTAHYTVYLYCNILQVRVQV